VLDFIREQRAVLLAILGVLNAVVVGQILWLALTLAVSSGCYGLLRKLSNVLNMLVLFGTS
jgi:EamA domain-containing membrane protein RarD